MVNKLKPCPFCGKKPIVVKVEKFPRGYYWAIQCDRSNVIVYTKSHNTKKEAIEEWNSRAGDAHNA